MQEGPSKMNMDIIQNMPLVDPNHVSSSVWNDNCVSTYTVGHNKDHPTPVQPFIHTVELKGRRGITAVVEGLFDDGALVNSICNSTFASLWERLGNPTSSSKTLLMADGARVSLHGCWLGDVSLGGRTARAAFEIFPSRGGWSLLFGKPLLQQFQAIHDYGNDILMIPSNGSWSTLLNESNKKQGSDVSVESENTLRGDCEPPSRQVSHPDTKTSEPIDKQELSDPFTITEHGTISSRSQSSKPIVAGLGIAWQPSGSENWKTWQDACTFCGGSGEHTCELTRGNNTPPSRQVQSPNQFSILGQLGDTILEHELDRRNRKSAYLPPDMQGYRVPHIFTVGAEEPNPKPRRGKKRRGRRNRLNRQKWEYPEYPVLTV